MDQGPTIRVKDTGAEYLQFRLMRLLEPSS